MEIYLCENFALILCKASSFHPHMEEGKHSPVCGLTRTLPAGIPEASNGNTKQLVVSAADGVCEGALLIISGGAEPLVSVAGWIKGELDMLDQDEPETGRGSWGRDSELDDEPTLLHDSDPEKKRNK